MARSFGPQMHGLLSYSKTCICQFLGGGEALDLPFIFNRVVSLLLTSHFRLSYKISFEQSVPKQNQTKSNWNKQTSLLTLRSGNLWGFSYKNRVQFSPEPPAFSLGEAPAMQRREPERICCTPVVLLRAQHNFPQERGTSGNITLRLSSDSTFPSWPMSYYVLMVKSTGFGLRYIYFKSWFLLMVSFLSVTRFLYPLSLSILNGSVSHSVKSDSLKSHRL